MKINIIAVGKPDPQLVAAMRDYQKRIAVWSELKIITIKEQTQLPLVAKKRRATTAILQKIPPQSHVILLSLQGELYDSVAFSNQISTMQHITFVIGGSDGVDEQAFAHKISFSPLTFPHKLCQLILLEQIYRALAIKNHSKYHK